MALRAAPRRAADGSTMDLSRLALTDFRSYAFDELRPHPGLTVIAAPNGAGKTNLLEAVHVAITGRSHRAATDLELVRHGAGLARVVLELSGGTAEGGATIELVLPGSPAAPGVRKRLTVNGVPRRSHLGVGDGARGPLPPGGDAAAGRVAIGAPPLPRRDPGPARPALRPPTSWRWGASSPSATPSCAPSGPRRQPSTASAFWDEQLATTGARVMRGRLAVVAELDERPRPAPRRGGRPDERGAGVRLVYVDALKEAWAARPAQAPAAGELPRRGRAGRRLPAPDRGGPPAGGVERGEPRRPAARRPPCRARRA